MRSMNTTKEPPRLRERSLNVTAKTSPKDVTRKSGTIRRKPRLCLAIWRKIKCWWRRTPD